MIIIIIIIIMNELQRSSITAINQNIINQEDVATYYTFCVVLI